MGKEVESYKSSRKGNFVFDNILGTDYIMHVISRKKLIAFYEQPKHQGAKGQIEAWYAEAVHAQWASPADVKVQYGSASIIGDNRVIFNIAGNKYRLIVRTNYGSKTVFVRFIGTHKAYDKIDAEVI